MADRPTRPGFVSGNRHGGSECPWTSLDPSNANRYQYAASNPINFMDPTRADILGDALDLAGITLATAGLGACIVGTGGPCGLAAASYAVTAGAYIKDQCSEYDC